MLLKILSKMLSKMLLDEVFEDNRISVEMQVMRLKLCVLLIFYIGG